jgi:hypothetical protein
MFIRLSKLLMGKHALAGKANLTGEKMTLSSGLRRQALPLAYKTA